MCTVDVGRSGVDILGTPTISSFVCLKHLASLFTCVEDMLGIKRNAMDPVSPKVFL